MCSVRAEEFTVLEEYGFSCVVYTLFSANRATPMSPGHQYQRALALDIDWSHLRGLKSKRV
jgi:hypothetical protein